MERKRKKYVEEYDIASLRKETLISLKVGKRWEIRGNGREHKMATASGRGRVGKA